MTAAAYSLHEINTREELDEFIEMCWVAWATPYNQSIRIGMRIYGYSAEDKARSIAELKDRSWADYQKFSGNKASRRHVYARHDPSGRIVGGLRLDFADGSPWPNGCPKLDMPWWPEGEEVKEFAEEMYQQIFTPRAVWMQRPHGGMQNFIVHPDHRGKGVGKLLLDYNARELDARGIEGYVEATELGRPAYEKGGYQVAMKVCTWLPAGKSDDWKRYYHEMAPTPFYAMWRPINGRIEPGERTKPWQLGQSIPI